MIFFSFVILQTADGSAMPLILEFLFGIILFFAIFLLVRSIMLWYWKVDTIVKNQEEQIRLLGQSFEQENRRNARVNYYKYIALGDNKNAHEFLIYIIYHDLTVPNIKPEDRKERYEKLKVQYGKKFESLGYEFPTFPFEI